MLTPIAVRAALAPRRSLATGPLLGLTLLLCAATNAVASPVAAFSIPQGPLHPGQPAVFDASGSSASAGRVLTSYRWTLADGTTLGTGPRLTWTFGTVTTVPLTLTVSEAPAGAPAGEPAAATVTHPVLVTPQPAAKVTSATTLGDGSASIAFTGASGSATFSCRLDSGPWSACTSPWSSPVLASGSHGLSVREVASDGEVQPIPTVATFTVAPRAPAVPPRAVTPAPAPQMLAPRTPTPAPAPRIPARPPGAPAPAPPGSPRPAHVGPRSGITPDDVAVGARKRATHGCADRNPAHPENVSHCGWPQITGMFFNAGATKCDVCPRTPDASLTIMGTPSLNDMLLGGRGDVTIIAGNGNNVLWADRVPNGPRTQKARITAGSGDNIVYAGPGTNTIVVGSGRNLIHAWQGRGAITCASQRSVVHVMRRSRTHYAIHGCTVTKGY